MGDPTLAPTLWRTCRVLANGRRLRLLRAMLETPSATVSELASATGTGEALCSLYLKNLQARGLCHAARTGRFVRYTAQPDPLVPHAAGVAGAVFEAFRAGTSDAGIAHVLTAYTHPVRLRLLAALGRGGADGLTVSELQTATGCSQAAASRHLAKLAARGVTEHAGGRVRALPPPNPLDESLRRWAMVESPD